MNDYLTNEQVVKLVRNKRIAIFGGGTIAHIASHLALCAPAYGSTARHLHRLMCNDISKFKDYDIDLYLSKMACGVSFETNADLAWVVRSMVQDLGTKIVFFTCAVVDFEPLSYLTYKDSVRAAGFGKCNQRLDSSETMALDMQPAQKVIGTIRKDRKDIFLVGFKTTCGLTDQEMYLRGLKLCKEASCNLVLVNDVKTRLNLIVTPEEAAYCATTDRAKVLKELLDMAYYRSQLTFTQSTVIAGKPVPWQEAVIPDNLRKVVEWLVSKGAYKPFNGATVGHFAARLSDTKFLTSIRRSNFNDIAKNGMVAIETSGPDTVLAYGAKPSVGGQSQRIVFKDHPGFDCIVHFHCELRRKHTDAIPVVSQKYFECGSHECGKNTSSNLAQFGPVKAVFLEQHGPNIVFSKTANVEEVIQFIDRNFDLNTKTGGYQLTTPV